MTTEQAIEVFVRGLATAKSLNGAYEATREKQVWIVRDGPGRKRPERLQEVVAYGVSPRQALAAAQAVKHKRHALCYIVDTDREIPLAKEQIKAFGYRLLEAEALFITTPVRNGVSLSGIDLRRVRTVEDHARVTKANRRRQASDADLAADDAPRRLFAAFEGGEAVGWVNSIRVGRAAWVANLFVVPGRRRNGIGSALMRFLLDDDARLGIETSVLLASKAGAHLYPSVGYKQIGTLLLFTKSQGRG